MPPDSGHDAAGGEGGGELGFAGHHPHIATERDVHAVAGGRAVQRADGWRVHRVQHGGRCVSQIEAFLPVALLAAAKARGAGVQIEAGAEELAAAGEHDGAHVAVRIRLQQVLGQLFQHDAADGVAGIRAVEGDGGDVVAHLVDHVLIRHRCLSPVFRYCASRSALHALAPASSLRIPRSRLLDRDAEVGAVFPLVHPGQHPHRRAARRRRPARRRPLPMCRASPHCATSERSPCACRQLASAMASAGLIQTESTDSWPSCTAR